MGRRRLFVVLAVLITGLVVVVVAFKALWLKTFRIPSESMAPTLEVGDRIATTSVSGPERGDVVVFHPPAGSADGSCGARHSARTICPRAAGGEEGSLNFIQRVAAVGGDRVSIRRGRTYIGGRRASEPYARVGDTSACEICELPDEVTIPAGQVLVLGDKRSASADGRLIGPVPEDWIVGELRLRYWPPGAIGSP